MIAYYKGSEWATLPVTSTTYLNYDFEITGDTSPFRVPYSSSITCRLDRDLLGVMNLPTHPLSSPIIGQVCQRRVFLCFCEGYNPYPVNPTSCGWAYVSGVTDSDITFSYSDITSDIIKDVLDQSTGAQSGEAEGKKRTLADIIPDFYQWDANACVSLYPQHVDDTWFFSKTYSGYETITTNALGNLVYPLFHASYGWGSSVTSTISKNRWNANDYAGGQCTSTLPITMGSVSTNQLQPILPIRSLLDWCQFKLSYYTSSLCHANIVFDTSNAPSLSNNYSNIPDVGTFHGYGIALHLFTEAISASPNDDIIELSCYNFTPNDKVQDVCSTKYGQLRLDDVADTDSTYYEFVWKFEPNACVSRSSTTRAIASGYDVYVFPRGIQGSSDLDSSGFPTASAVDDGHCFVFRQDSANYWFHYRHDYTAHFDCTVNNITHKYYPPLINEKPCWFIKNTSSNQWVDAHTQTQTFYNACKIDRFESVDMSGKKCGNIQPEGWSYYAAPTFDSEHKLDNPERVQPSCVIKGPAHDRFNLFRYFKKSDTPLSYLSKILSYFNISVVPNYINVLSPTAIGCMFQLFEYNAISSTTANGTLTSLSPSPYTGSKVVFKADSAKDYLSDTYALAYPKQPFGSFTFETGIKNCEFNNASDSKAIMPSYCLVKKWANREGIDLNNPWHYDLGQGCANISSDSVMTCAFDKDNKQVDLHNGIFALVKFNDTDSGKSAYSFNTSDYTQQLVMNTRVDYGNTSDSSPSNPNSLLVAIANDDGTGWFDYAPDFNTYSGETTLPYTAPGRRSVLRRHLSFDSGRRYPVNALRVGDKIIDFTSYGTPKILYGDYAFNPANIEHYVPHYSATKFNITDRSNWKGIKFKCKTPPNTIPAKLSLNVGASQNYDIYVKKLQINPLGDTPDEGEGYLVLTEDTTNNYAINWSSSTGTFPSGSSISITLVNTSTQATRVVTYTPSDTYFTANANEVVQHVVASSVSGWGCSASFDNVNKIVSASYTQTSHTYTIIWNSVPDATTPSVHLYSSIGNLLGTVTYPTSTITYYADEVVATAEADTVPVYDQTYVADVNVYDEDIDVYYQLQEYTYNIVWGVSVLPTSMRNDCYVAFNTGERIDYPNTTLTTTHKPNSITGVYSPPTTSDYKLKSVPSVGEYMYVQYVRAVTYRVDWTGPDVPQSSSHMVGGTISQNGTVICTYPATETSKVVDSRNLSFSLPNLQGYSASINEDSGIIYFSFKKLYNYEVVWNGPFPDDTRILFNGDSIYAPDVYYNTHSTPPSIESDKHLKIDNYGTYIGYAYATVNTDYLSITATASSSSAENYFVDWSSVPPTSDVTVVWRDEDVCWVLTRDTKNLMYCSPNDLPPLSGDEWTTHIQSDENAYVTITVDTSTKTIKVNWN